MRRFKKRAPGAPSINTVRAQLQEALDPEKRSKPVERFSKMSPEKRAEMERLYGGGPPARKGEA